MITQHVSKKKRYSTNIQRKLETYFKKKQKTKERKTQPKFDIIMFFKIKQKTTIHYKTEQIKKQPKHTNKKVKEITPFFLLFFFFFF